MANLFDAANAPETEPDEFVIGDFVQWKRSDLHSDYPNDTYTATYISRMAQGGGNHEFQVVGTASGTDFLFTIASATSASFDAGHHHWHLEIVRDSDSSRIVIDQGHWDVGTDIDVTGVDPRSHAEIMVDKIQSLLENRADTDVSNYSIQGRSLVKLTIDDLLRWRDYYASEVAREKRKERRKRGKPTGATIVARF